MLTEMDVHEVLKHIADSDEKCANDVIYAMTLLSTNVSKMLESVKGQMLNQITENNFDNLDRLREFCNNIMELHKQVESSIDALIKDSSNAKKAKDIIQIDSNDTHAVNDISSRNAGISYNHIPLNTSTPHPLIENFEYKKICGFILFDTYHEVKNWQNALMSVCNLLYLKDKKLFSDMTQNPDFIKRKVPYFAKSSIVTKSGYLRNSYFKNANVFVLTNLSANDICLFIRKMLSFYQIPIDSFSVYLKADYGSLQEAHQNR